MAVYLTGYSDYVAGFREPPLPPYRFHTSLKKMSGEITKINKFFGNWVLTSVISKCTFQKSYRMCKPFLKSNLQTQSISTRMKKTTT